MRIGIFSDSINIPPTEGINVHTYGVAKALAQRDNVDILLVVCDRGWLNLDILADQPFDTMVIPSSQFYDQSAIEKIMVTEQLDVVQTYMVYFAAVVLGPASWQTKIPMCVEFHDLERAIVPIYLDDPAEIAFHDELQRRAGNLASFVRVMSAYDYDQVNRMWPELRPVTQWLPVSIEASIGAARTSHTGGALFIGNTSYPPNAAAAAFIANTLAPQIPDVPIILVGRGTEHYAGRQSVSCVGIAPSLTDYLTTSSIGLAPIFEGSGMKIKLLDYLSAGLPVITTPLGAYGYPESPAIIVEDDMDKWPELVKKLYADPDLDQLSQSAQTLFRDHFDLERNITALIDTYMTLPYQAVGKPDNFPHLAVDQSKIYWLSEDRATPRPPVADVLYIKGRA